MYQHSFRIGTTTYHGSQSNKKGLGCCCWPKGWQHENHRQHEKPHRGSTWLLRRSGATRQPRFQICAARIIVHSLYSSAVLSLLIFSIRLLSRSSVKLKKSFAFKSSWTTFVSFHHCSSKLLSVNTTIIVNLRSSLQLISWGTSQLILCGSIDCVNNIFTVTSGQPMTLHINCNFMWNCKHTQEIKCCAASVQLHIHHYLWAIYLQISSLLQLSDIEAACPCWSSPLNYRHVPDPGGPILYNNLTFGTIRSIFFNTGYRVGPTVGCLFSQLNILNRNLTFQIP